MVHSERRRDCKDRARIRNDKLYDNKELARQGNVWLAPHSFPIMKRNALKDSTRVAATHSLCQPEKCSMHNDWKVIRPSPLLSQDYFCR